MHYSVDFRKKVLEYANTHTIQETAKTFSISEWAVSAWRKLLKTKGNLEPAPLNRKPRKLDYEKLKKYIEANPDKYLREIAEEFKCCIETIRRAIIRLGFTIKKKRNYTGKEMRRGERSIRKKYQSIEKKI
jgi:transposase